MPVNAGHEYFEAERKFGIAKSADERLAALYEMLKAVPKHKGTETLTSELNKRIKKTKEEIDKRQEQNKKTSSQSLSVKKEGSGQITIIGLPNSGKSTFLKELTNANVEIASYPYTTTKPEIGMLNYHEALIQLVEVPPIVKGSSTGKFQGNELLSIVRNSDALAIILNSESPLREYELLKSELENSDIKINSIKPKLKLQKSEFKGMVISGKENLRLPLEEFQVLLKQNGYQNCTVIIEEKIGKEQVLEVLNEKLVYKKAGIFVLTHKTTNLEELQKLRKKTQVIELTQFDSETKIKLGDQLFELLEKILIYTKRPGDDAAKLPLAVPIGSTVEYAAKVVHKEIAQNLKFAKVWGSAKFEGQKVGKEYVLQNKDIIELYF
ncbi:MAG: GTPase [Candidatus Diapherotrites archaeon]|nr:GTPase [Candidatus Diapherotrites archaeon]